MRILLFGEFSGLFNCLQEGLRELGHEVTLISDGDSFKDYPSDYRYDLHFIKKMGKFKAPLSLLNLWLHKHLLKGFDIVYFMDPSLVSRHPDFNSSIYRYMMRHNKKSFLCGAGDTAIMVKYWIESDAKYYDYVKGLNDRFIRDGCVSLYPNEKLMRWEHELISSVNGYIPIWYEYAQPFRNYKTILPTIRIPINVKKIEYKPNVVIKKIIFFHGIPSRPEAKGTSYIKQAFSIMENKYGDIAEFYCAGGLPFNDYINLIRKTNVVVDDAQSYSIAMNGLFSMAQGKIVMGGAEPEGNKELGIEGVNPVFNITNNVDQICSQIEYIIKNKDKIEDWGLASRQFVEKYHDHIKIAKQYEHIFKEALGV